MLKTDNRGAYEGYFLAKNAIITAETGTIMPDIGSNDESNIVGLELNILDEKITSGLVLEKAE